MTGSGVSTMDASREHASRRAFGRGLRQRHPLVLVAALVLLLPVLLVIEYLFTSGAWTAVPLKYWISSPKDTWAYVTWNTSHLKSDPPRVPAVALVGGSSAREAIASGDSLSAAVESQGGPSIVARNLASPKQSLGGSLAIVDNLPDAPTTVLIGVNLARLYQAPDKNTGDVYGRDLVLENDALIDYVERTYEPYRFRPHIFPGLFRFLTTRAAAASSAALRHDPLVIPYNLHSMDSQPTMTDAKLESIRRWANGEKALRQLRKNLPATVDLLDATITRAQEKGLDVVIVELPHNPAASGAGFRTSQAYYQGELRELAAKRDVTYLDFNENLPLKRADFIDFSHLRASGRAVWERRLAEELVRLYRSGAISGGKAAGGSQGGTTSASPGGEPQ